MQKKDKCTEEVKKTPEVPGSKMSQCTKHDQLSSTTNLKISEKKSRIHYKHC